jgi:hypothetical protein
MLSEVSRYKINQQVREVLVRHGVDLRKLDFSFTGRALYLSGQLARDGGGDYAPTQIRCLLDELLRHKDIAHLQCDLDNWVVTHEFGVCQIKLREPDEKRRKRL